MQQIKLKKDRDLGFYPFFYPLLDLGQTNNISRFCSIKVIQKKTSRKKKRF